MAVQKLQSEWFGSTATLSLMQALRPAMEHHEQQKRRETAVSVSQDHTRADG